MPAKPTSRIAHVDPSPGGDVAGSPILKFFVVRWRAGTPHPLSRCGHERRACLRFCQAKEGAAAMQITSFKDMYIAELQELASMERQMEKRFCACRASTRVLP
jgi:hypothetical protein